jgi:predicted ATPase/class 3 adenylate cyclase
MLADMRGGGPVAVEAELSIHTFLFTDVEGSTRRWQAHPEAMPAQLAAHDKALSEAVGLHRGRVFKHTGDGICAVFDSVRNAVSAAVDAQRTLELPVRMAVHSGEAIERDRDFFGVSLSRCARLMEAAHGGQVLLSASSALVADRLGPGIELRDLGEHRLRDLREPERIFQVFAAGLAREFPALRSLDAGRHNLPIVRSSFVGRELELVDVCERVSAGRLVTLTGIGGCGKTRLALAAAARLIDRFSQGVFFVELAVLSDPGLLGQAVASALELQLLDTGIDSLVESLATRKLLLVLDNCEHLLDGCAELVDRLQARCPELAILATSREALGVDGEQVFRVPSLKVETDAVRLFFDRAQAAGARLPPDSANEDTVAQICRRLDGIPLAIELAAARTPHLAAAQILERLSDRFRLLTGGRRRVQRQQTLSAAIDWSHDLLTDDEKTLFSSLAVFRGSFSLQAVEEICHRDAVELLGSLVNKSLVNAQLEGSVVRYRLLETVRLYAEERLLASGKAIQLRCAHRDWLLNWLESLPVGELLEIGGGDQLLPEADNLSAALEWSLEQGRLDLVTRMAARMLAFWWSNVRVAELAAWWRALELNLARLPDDLRPAALLVGVQHALAAGDWVQMEKRSAQALTLAAPDSWVAAYAWTIQALYWTYADPERGMRSIDDARKAADSAGLPEFARVNTLWSLNLLTGDPERDEQIGGRELLDRVLSTIEEDPPAQVLSVLGIAAALGETDRASRLAASVSPRTPLQRFGAQFLAAMVAIRDGQTEAGYEHLRTQAAIVREYAIPLGEISCLLGFAALAVATGDHETASRHLASVKASGPFPFRTPAEAIVYRQTARALRGSLNPSTIARCRAEGAATPARQALDAELSRLDGSSTTVAQAGDTLA